MTTKQPEHYAQDGKSQTEKMLMTTPTPDPRAYKDTLNLPKTDFPMMPPHVEDRVKGERVILDKWRDEKLYDQTRKNRQGALYRFTLHDGPPYANGDIHIGHAVNKVLKDILVRWKTLLGFDAQFVPGWDCHGLPIEQAVQKAMSESKTQLSPAEFRSACRDYASKYVQIQSEQFRLLGINADFEYPYLTTQPQYEDGVLSLLEKLVESGAVYRDKKPVHWCTEHKTALADAELEYKDVTDDAVYVMFETEAQYSAESSISKESSALDNPWKKFVRAGGLNNIAMKFMVWTTTPWTIPANRAIAINPDLLYTAVVHGDYIIVVGNDVASKLFGDSCYKSQPFTGSELVGMKYKSFDGTVCPVIEARFVTADVGTGLVHIAPGHGPEDFAVGKANGIEVKTVVDAAGKFDSKESAALVVKILESNGSLFSKEKITHSVAHCWRCHNPVIFLATEQWFIKAEDGSPLNEMAVENAKASKWHPEAGLARFSGMLKTRPDWCISRQRLWGIPIPYFLDKNTGEAKMDAKTIYTVRKHFLKHGSNSWYTDSVTQILGSGFEHFEKGTDILDVWFESGASHEAVLETGGVLDLQTAWEQDRNHLGSPADVYLEGSDQHRGWFQSSMLTAYNLGHSPAKTFITHGFVLDKDGRKMSKELGNVIKVTDAVNEYGTDVLRLWVASVDYTGDVVCSKELFRNTVESYRKIRNTFRYLLSNLYDYGKWSNQVDNNRDSIEHYMLWRLSDLRKTVFAAYEAYDFKTVAKLHYDFYNIEVSAFYAKAAKDRLYCEARHDLNRQRAQRACLALLTSGLLTLSPILPILCEEVWQSLRKLECGKHLEASVHQAYCVLYHLQKVQPQEYTGAWGELYKLVSEVTVQLDAMKKSNGLTNPLDAEVVITIVQGGNCSQYGRDFEDACGVGYHTFKYGDKLSVEVLDSREKYPRCERSRKRRPDVGYYPEFPTLSKRDAEVVRGLSMSDDL